MAFDEDLTLFFDEDSGFAVEATYTPAGFPHPSSQTRTISVIFDKEFFHQVGGDVGIIGDQPQALCIASDVADIENGPDPLTFINAMGGAMTIKGQQYTIISPNPDGTGLITLLLQTDA